LITTPKLSPAISPLPRAEQDQSGQLRQPASSTVPWAVVTAVLCLALVALVGIMYRQTLGSYFMADDFGEIFYMSRIWSGEWNLYLADWVSNTMNVPGMAVYRPWFVTSLVIDFFFWRGNPFGYYLSNITYFAADVLLFFFVVRLLTTSWSTPRSLACSFSAAALFALSPLHCESISWVGGRTDTICATYFLAGLFFFLLARARSSTAAAAASLVAFWMAMLTKEMAIALPILATTIAFLYPLRTEHPETPRLSAMGTRIKDSLNESSALWISTVGYFAARYLALGTMLGGYTAGLGQAQSTGALGTWLDTDTYRRLVFPFAADIVSTQSSLAFLLLAAYTVAGLAIIVRVSRGQLPGRSLLLLGVWALAAALPLYKLWGIGPNLEGARYCFFLTMPGSLLLPLLLFSPLKTEPAGGSASNRFALAYTVVAVLIMGAVLFVNARTLNKTNREWVAAGQEVRAITSGAATLVENLPAGKDRILIFSVPKTHLGAHMIYNGPTLMTALKPPFTTKNYESKIESTDHLFFGLDRYINSARFKQLLNSGTVDGPYAWDLADKRFFRMIHYPSAQSKEALILPLNMTASSAQIYANHHAVASGDGKALHLTNLQRGDGLRFGNLHINPLDVDFVETEYRLPGKESGPLTFEARWQGSDMRASSVADLCAVKTVEAPPADKHAAWQTVRIPVSHFWRWYGCGNISALSVVPPAVSEIEIRKITLVPDAHLRPTLKVGGAKVDGSGVHYVTAASSVQVDASTIKGAVSTVLESTRPDFFFDQGASSNSGLHSSTKLSGLKSTIPFKTAGTPLHAFCEMRVQALDAKGNPVGEPSEPAIVFAP
jgi:hypothetical protein